MHQVIIFTYLQRHLKKMLPVIDVLNNDKRINLTVILMTQEEQDIASQHGIGYKMLDEFTQNKRNYDFDPGWGIEPLINAIDSIRPDLFLAIEVNFILRNAIRYCKQQHIPNMIIQHGTPNKYSLHAFAPFEGDCFAAWGEFTRDFLIANKVPEDKIVITGGVPFDRTLLMKPDKANIALDIDADPAKKWILFTTQGVGAGNRPSEEEIFAGVTEVALHAMRYVDHQLIFQVHPGQTIADIKEMVDTVGNHGAIVTKYKDTEELIAASDFMITFFSTTAIDAVILKKPLLLINLTDDKDFFPFVKMGAAFGVYEKEKIAEALANLLCRSDETAPNMLKAACYVNFNNDAKALARVMQLCYDKFSPVKKEIVMSNNNSDTPSGTFIIAEIGCNHKGDIEIAKELIKVAAVFCKVDGVKFQKRNSRELLSAEEYNAPHPNPAFSYGSTYGEHREALEFTLDQHKELVETCKQFNIDYSSSVWDITSAKEIMSLNPKYIKIPSACNLNFSMLGLLADTYPGEIHLSFGMTSKEEEEKIVKFFTDKRRNKDLVIYSCVSGYPVDFDDLSLLDIKRLKEKFGSEVKGIGFSGHHLGIAADIAALTLGARYFERHFTLDRTWKGTDHAASLEPDGMRKLARDIRNVSKALTYKREDILDIEKVQRMKLKREFSE